MKSFSETERLKKRPIAEKGNDSRVLSMPTTSVSDNYNTTNPRWSLPNRLPTDFLSTIQQVLSEVREARRLKRQVDSLLQPNERQWIDRTIAETDATARDIAALLEPRRVAREIGKGGKIGLGNRVRWALRDSRRAKEKAAQLVLSRNSLMVVLGNLHMRDSALSPASLPATPKPTSIPTLAAELDSLSIFAGSGKEGGEIRAKKSSPLNFELSEMLAWRRSKGAWSTASHEFIGLAAVDSSSSSFLTSFTTTSPILPSETKIVQTKKIKRKPVPAGPIPTIKENGSRIL
ncbi:hypothetical protein EMCG_03278 [[Emmonsia] crescens]|uniref:Uncharacterized protein n=1 Tax=[Emmonsia] crescens TaxID=73230 RepID=A0A0G2J8I8_9EURO|nr:hypothetical protein EMCG_03278 [Emmonsia crescens UAMH 3008]